MIIASPAKINLFLCVKERRQDGYHELASLFQAISLFDTLEITLAHTDAITCSDPLLPIDERNLVVKAIHLFRAKTGLTAGVKLHLDKKIPQQAGLGGGSSNAATTLFAINALSGYPATELQLMRWAAEIGSDVPFFFSTGTAYVTGRGETLQPLDKLPLKTTVSLFKPERGLSTADVYQSLDIATIPQRNPLDLLRQWQQGNPACVNDLEPSAYTLFPELLQLKQSLLDSGFTDVLLSGSGSTLFCLGEGTLQNRPDLFVQKSRFIQRCEGNWYLLDSH